MQRIPYFRVYPESKEASLLKQKSGDISLAPVLFLSAGYLSDKKQPNQLSANESLGKKYSLGLVEISYRDANKNFHRFNGGRKQRDSEPHLFFLR